MNAVTQTTGKQVTPATLEDVLVRGNLGDLTTPQRIEYVNTVCRHLGLNPLTRPFQFLNLQGRTVMYATKDACDQLRKIHGISIEIVGHTISDGLMVVTARATEVKTGRTDQDYGAVFVGAVKGEALANAHMKATTKAKRRVTLSIVGLGFADAGDDDTDAGIVEGEVNETRQEPRTIAPRLPEQKKPAAVHDISTGPGEEVEGHRDGEQAQREETGIVPGVIERKGDSATAWSLWGQDMLRAVKQAPTVEAIDAWTKANYDHLTELEKHDEGKFKKLTGLIAAELAKKAPPHE